MVQTRSQRRILDSQSNAADASNEDGPTSSKIQRRSLHLLPSDRPVSELTSVRVLNGDTNSTLTVAATIPGQFGGMGQTMTYMCSDLNARPATGAGTDCTCYYIRNSVDLQNMGDELVETRRPTITKSVAIVVIISIIAAAACNVISDATTDSPPTLSQSPVVTRKVWSEVLMDYVKHIFTQ